MWLYSGSHPRPTGSFLCEDFKTAGLTLFLNLKTAPASTGPSLYLETGPDHALHELALGQEKEDSR